MGTLLVCSPVKVTYIANVVILVHFLIFTFPFNIQITVSLFSKPITKWLISI